MAVIIPIDNYRVRHEGNGAMETLRKTLTENPILGATDVVSAADIILADLWIRGFKVVPLDHTDGEGAR